MKNISLQHIALWLSFRIFCADARVLSTPTATLTCPNHGLRHDFVPQVTPPPRVAELRARQTTSESDTLATCGFINGDADKPVTCGTSLYCATTSTFVGCCELTNCRDIFTACYDLLGDACDQSCQNNPQNLVCPTSLPYCAVYNYEGGSVGIGCALISGYTSTVLLTVATTGPGTLTTPSPSPSESSVSPTPTPTPASSGLSTGATAGIGVGAALGVLVVGLIAFGFWRHSRKSKKAARGATENPTETKQASTSQPDRESKAISELPHSPRSPVSPEFQQQAYNNGQPSPGPPHYSQHMNNTLYEMEGSSDRPVSYATTELDSNRH